VVFLSRFENFTFEYVRHRAARRGAIVFEHNLPLAFLTKENPRHD